MPQRSTNDVSCNLDLRVQLASVKSKLDQITEDAQKLIDKGVMGAKTVCKNIIKNTGQCSNLTLNAETNADKMTPDGCTSYSLTRLINVNKRKLLLGEADPDSPNLRPRFIQFGELNIPDPISGKYSAVEACEVLVDHEGKGNMLIKHFIENKMIPVKMAMMYRILDLLKKADDAIKKTITWKSRGQPKILSDNSFSAKLSRTVCVMRRQGITLTFIKLSRRVKDPCQMKRKS